MSFSKLKPRLKDEAARRHIGKIAGVVESAILYRYSIIIVLIQVCVVNFNRLVTNLIVLTLNDQSSS